MLEGHRHYEIEPVVFSVRVYWDHVNNYKGVLSITRDGEAGTIHGLHGESGFYEIFADMLSDIMRDIDVKRMYGSVMKANWRLIKRIFGKKFNVRELGTNVKAGREMTSFELTKRHV